MKTKWTMALILCPALMLGALDAQTERPEIRILVDADKCKLHLDVYADWQHDWICGVVVSRTERRHPIFADKIPVLSDAMLLASGLSRDGRFQIDADLPHDADEDVFFQAILMDSKGAVDATSVLRVRQRDWKIDADQPLPPKPDTTCHRADADQCQDSDVESVASPDTDTDMLERLQLELLSTDSIPPWYSLLATFKAPGSGYHLGVRRVDHREADVAVYLVLTTPSEDASDADDRAFGDIGDGTELLYAGAELGFDPPAVKVFFAVDRHAEELRYGLVRCFQIEK